MCILCYVKCSEGVCALFPWHAVSDSLSRVQTASKRSWMRRKLGSAFNSLSALPITIRSRSTRCWQTFSSPLALFTKSCHQDRNLLQAAVASSDLTGMSHSAVFGFYIYHVFLQRHVGVQLRWCCQVPLKKKKKKQIGPQDGSVDKSAKLMTRKRKLTPESCPLNFTCTLWHIHDPCVYIHAHTHTLQVK